MQAVLTLIAMGLELLLCTLFDVMLEDFCLPNPLCNPDLPMPLCNFLASPRLPVQRLFALPRTLLRILVNRPYPVQLALPN